MSLEAKASGRSAPTSSIVGGDRLDTVRYGDDDMPHVGAYQCAGRYVYVSVEARRAADPAAAEAGQVHQPRR
jgi:hypothetical protein